MATAPASLIKNLDIASQRIKRGNTYSGYATDVKNLNYAKSKYGYSYKPAAAITPQTPVPGNQLGQPNPYEDISKIIGTTITPDMVSPEIAGLLAIQNQTTESQKQYSDTQNQLLEQIKQLGGQGADLKNELDLQGVTQAYQQVKELNLRGAQLQGQIEKFDVDTAKQAEALGEQAIPTGLISGQQSQLQRNRDLTKAGMAAELGATAALSQAYQGNAQLGTQLAQQAVDLKYQPMLNNLEVLKTQLSFAGEKMTKDDQKRANVINAIIAEQQEKITTQKELENQIQAIAIEAATNGAPTSIVTAIKGSTSAIDAVKSAQKYLTVNVQRQQQLADEDRQFGREKELIAYRESFQGSGDSDFTLKDAAANPLLAFQVGGGQRIQKADGGFDFIAPDGRKITVEEAVNLTGVGAKSDFLKDSESMQDVRSLQSQKAPTMTQETTALYASRIKQANDIFQTLESYTKNLSPTKFYAQTKAPDFLNFLRSKDFQSYDQAQRNFVNAVLRRESGAVISDAEFKNARLQYFPQPGDKAETLKQKKANRDLVQKQFIQGSGSAYVSTNVPKVKSTTSGTTSGGVKYKVLP